MYERPPVIETLLGVEFEPLEGWTVVQYGLFWELVRDRYPAYSVQPPVIAPEAMEGQFASPLHLNSIPVRCWFIDDARGRLIQIQPDRFIHNWRRDPGDHQYPRYAQTKPMFQGVYETFLEFLRASDLPAPRVTRCEVTYINHIERGPAWANAADLPRVLRPWAGMGDAAFLPSPDSADMDIYFPMPGPKDRLHVQLRRAVRRADAVELLQLSLTARGVPASSSIEDVLRWFDVGREWIVRGFTDLTTDRLHELWGRR